MDPETEKLSEPLPAAASLVSDYCDVLLGMIEASKDNPAGIRNLVYECARLHLRREIFVSNPTIERTDAERQICGLEEAIERVENILHDDSLWALKEAVLSGQAEVPLERSGLDYPRDDLRAVRNDYEAPIQERSPLRRDRSTWLGVRKALQLSAVLIFCILGVAALAGQFELRKPAPSDLFKNRFVEVPAAHLETDGRAVADVATIRMISTAPFPASKSYAVYAVSRGQLVELDRLMTRSVEGGRLISSDVHQPSQTTLAEGKPNFVLFRRDWPNGTPETVSVRVVAQVRRELVFREGTAKTNELVNLWHIRDKFHELRIAPLGRSSELVFIRPAGGTELPPGRYALQIGGLSYDFTIAGSVTDLAQCVERSEAVDGAIFTECRAP